LSVRSKRKAWFVLDFIGIKFSITTIVLCFCVITSYINLSTRNFCNTKHS